MLATSSQDSFLILNPPGYDEPSPSRERRMLPPTSPKTEAPMTNEATDTIDVAGRRRGPFGPARDLVPEHQALVQIPGDCSCRQALDRLVDEDFSAAPLVVKGVITGVFSLREVSRSLLLSTGMKVTDVLEQPAATFAEDATFLDPDLWVDTTVDWRENEWVIVGSPTDAVGILTVTDVWARLNDFAEAFVLLHEIELDLRVLINRVLGNTLPTLIASVISKSPETPSLDGPATLVDLTFDQYRQLILDGNRGWPAFESVILRARTRFLRELEKVRDIRNAAMHHRRAIRPRDCQELRRFHRVIRDALTRARQSP